VIKSAGYCPSSLLLFLDKLGPFNSDDVPGERSDIFFWLRVSIVGFIGFSAGVGTDIGSSSELGGGVSIIRSA
jgi:hypothetical protein